MKKLLFMLLLFATTVAVATPVKVACVGNSITYGAGVVNRDKNSYPAQLQCFLGPNYEVVNFGVNSTTLLSKGDYPYITTQEYKNSLKYTPDIVLIKLGTNDSKDRNADKLDGYIADYQSLIDSYKAVNHKVRIILLQPVYCYLTTDGWSGNAKAYRDIIVPSIEQLAYNNSLEIVDLYHLFANEWEESLFPDKLHPSSLGATIMARRIGEVVELVGDNFHINAPQGNTPFNFHGYQGYAMGEDKIVEPRHTAKGNPWVLRARFWGHEPQTDIALLEKGFHIAYCDVADMYGSPKALKKYDAFYKKLTSMGLSKKVVLEGMSRGGLIALNWAAANANKVAAIYVDAPVMDIKSWPMGNGGNENDTKQMMSAYGFKTKEEAMAWKKNPVDQIEKLRNIPIILVVGDADEVVPVKENGSLLEAAALPTFKAIHKPNIGHHPHSLFCPEPVVTFILRATNLWQNPCTRAVAGSEYRSAAGWKEGSDWHAISEDITAALASKQVNLLLLGNSITQAMGSHSRKLITTFAGTKAMDAVCSSWESAGISGDKTQSLLWRVQNGAYEKCSPKYVTIAIGVNNIGAGDSAQDIAQGIEAVASAAALKFPQARILLLGLLPVGLEPTDSRRLVYNEIQNILSKHKFENPIEYHDPTSWFVGADGRQLEGLYSGDNLHLVEKGYQVWCNKIVELIKK
ncbi:MAG: GDSL-type esterase/lipase family protein [Mucinivorans sp.]